MHHQGIKRLPLKLGRGRFLLSGRRRRNLYGSGRAHVRHEPCHTYICPTFGPESSTINDVNAGSRNRERVERADKCILLGEMAAVRDTLQEISTSTRGGFVSNEDVEITGFEYYNDAEDPGDEEEDAETAAEGMTYKIAEADRNEAANLLLQSVDSPLRKLFKWDSLISILAVTGSSRFSVDQCNFFRSVVNWLLDVIRQISFCSCKTKSAAVMKAHDRYFGSSIPAYSTLYRTLIPALRLHGLPHTEKILLPAKVSCSRETPLGAHTSDAGNRTTHVSRAVLVLKPSTWAVRDMSFAPILQKLRESAAEPPDCISHPRFKEIHEAPLLHDKASFLLPHNHIFADFQKVAEGEAISIQLRQTPSVNNTSISKEYANTLEIQETPHQRNVLLRAVVHETVLVVSAQEAPCKSVEQKSVTSAMSREQHNAQRVPLWRVGDLCTKLTVSADNSWACVLVHRHCRGVEYVPPTALVWIPKTQMPFQISLHAAHVQTVIGISIAIA